MLHIKCISLHVLFFISNDLFFWNSPLVYALKIYALFVHRECLDESAEWEWRRTTAEKEKKMFVTNISHANKHILFFHSFHFIRSMKEKSITLVNELCAQENHIKYVMIGCQWMDFNRDQVFIISYLKNIDFLLKYVRERMLNIYELLSAEKNTAHCI